MPSTPIKLTEDRRNFNRGFATACSIMLQNHDEPGMVRETFECNFMTVSEMRQCGVEKLDIEVLKPIIKEINRKRKISKHG